MLFFQHKLLRIRSRNIVEIVQQAERRSFWYAHPEEVLQTMLDIENKNGRKLTLKIILDIKLMRRIVYGESVEDCFFRVKIDS